MWFIVTVFACVPIKLTYLFHLKYALRFLATTFVRSGLPPDSLTIDQDRIYWSSDSQRVMNSVDKYSGLDFIAEGGSAGGNVIAIGENLQPMPGLVLYYGTNNINIRLYFAVDRMRWNLLLGALCAVVVSLWFIG